MGGSVVKILRRGEPVPDGMVEVPKGNDRWFRVTVYNRGRTIQGTATVWRWYYLLRAVKKRHHSMTMTPPPKTPILVRRWPAGPVIAICEALEGPVKRLMN